MHRDEPNGRLVRLSKRAISYIIAAGAFVMAAMLAVLAHSSDRPVTTALVFVFGITAVGATSGVRGGLLSAVTASIIYNFFLSDPYLSFVLSSADDLVPLLAFNVSAIASGLLAGRLRDRAEVAERSKARVEDLLKLSEALQRAKHPDEMRLATETLLQGATTLICLKDGRQFGSADNHPKTSTPQGCRDSNQQDPTNDRVISSPIGSPSQSLGIIKAIGFGDEPPTDVKGPLALLSIAIERWVLRDQLAEADLLRRSEEFKTILLSSVSHDLRTPLSVMSASASSLRRFKDKLDDATRTDLLETIEEQCGRLNRLTTNLLNLGRIQGGMDATRMPTIDAIEVLGSALSRARPLAQDHRISKQIPADPAPVRSDATMLEQVFFNVIENALVHTPAGSDVRIVCHLRAGHITAIVEDDGLGISAANLEHIFDRFYQDPSSYRSQGGVGLGLSIARGFARAIGGDVSASNSEKGGAKIAIRLPLCKGSDIAW